MGFCGEKPGDGRLDDTFPFPNGQIGSGSDWGFVGLDVGDPNPAPATPIPLKVLWPTSTHDVMTYCAEPLWLSSHTYEGVRSRLLAENILPIPPSSLNALNAVASVTTTQPVVGGNPGAIAMLSGPMVHVAAIVNLTRGTGTIEYVTPVQRAEPQVGATDRAALVVRDGSGRKLSNTPVVLDETTYIPPGADQTALVDAAVPFNSGMAEIDLVLGSSVIAQYRNVPTAPKAPSALQLLSAISNAPPGGAAEAGPILTWTLPVGAAGTVTYTVQTSDDGKVWSTIAVGLTEPSLMLISDEEQTGARMVRVIASNGFRSAPPVVLRLKQ
jgi:hypothetical protein